MGLLVGILLLVCAGWVVSARILPSATGEQGVASASQTDVCDTVLTVYAPNATPLYWANDIYNYTLGTISCTCSTAAGCTTQLSNPSPLTLPTDFGVLPTSIVDVPLSVGGAASTTTFWNRTSYGPVPVTGRAATAQPSKVLAQDATFSGNTYSYTAYYDSAYVLYREVVIEVATSTDGSCQQYTKDFTLPVPYLDSVAVGSLNAGRDGEAQGPLAEGVLSILSLQGEGGRGIPPSYTAGQFWGTPTVLVAVETTYAQTGCSASITWAPSTSSTASSNATNPSTITTWPISASPTGMGCDNNWSNDTTWWNCTLPGGFSLTSLAITGPQLETTAQSEESLTGPRSNEQTGLPVSGSVPPISLTSSPKKPPTKTLNPSTPNVLPPVSGPTNTKSSPTLVSAEPEQASKPPPAKSPGITPHQTPPSSIFVIGGQTASVGGSAITVSGTRISVGASGVVIGGSTQTFRNPVVTLGSSTLTANAQSQFMVNGQTLSLGGPAATIAGTPVSVIVGGVVFGSSTAVAAGPAITFAGSTITAQQPPSEAGFAATAAAVAPTLIFEGQTFTANPQSDFVVGGKTLTPGGTITVSGTPVAYPDAEALGGGDTPGGPLLTVGEVVYTADAQSDFAIAGQTLVPGGTVQLGGTVLSLEPDATEVVVGGKTKTLRNATPTASASASSSGDGSTYGPMEKAHKTGSECSRGRKVSRAAVAMGVLLGLTTGMII